MYVIVVYILALYLPLYQGHCHLKWENDHIVNIQNGSKLKQRGVLKQVITQYIWCFFFLKSLDELTSLFCLYLSGWVEQQRRKIQWRKRHRWWEIFPCFINFVFLIIWGVILVTKLFNIPATCAFYHTQKSGDVNCTRKTPRVR